MDERLAGKRDPYLRARVPRERVATYWGGQVTQAEITNEINDFRARLRALGPYRPLPVAASSSEVAP
jgi:coenzyme F420-reducing hydrogenase delta subunit